MRKTLFRTGLAVARADAWHGNVVLLQPLSQRLLGICIMLFAIATVVFLFQADYTRRMTVAGVVAPDSGLIRVQPPSSGIVLERLVREGQQVRAGDALYKISAETVYAPESGRTQRLGATAVVLEQLRSRQTLIESDQSQTAAIERRERRDAAARLASLQAEMSELGREIALQQERMASQTQVYERHAQAQAQGFLSPLALQQKYEELLDQKARLQALQRTRFGLEREADAVRAAASTAAERSALAQSELERQIAQVRQDRVAREVDRGTLVTAPQDGVVAVVLAEPGQRVDGDTMLTIMPRPSRLEVQVMLPSAGIGNLRTGDTVKVRFAAFPYQQFGDVAGTVSAISATALPRNALDDELLGAAQAPGDDGHFRIRIALPSQTFRSGDRALALRPGMKTDVVFVQERRRLIEWLVAPVAGLLKNT